MSLSSQPYKRRRPSMVRNFWIYRRLVGLAMLLGLTLWFVLTNNATVTVFFPFGLGSLASTTGMVILLSMLAGSAATALAGTILIALRRPGAFGPAGRSEPDLPDPISGVELPPADYAAKTPDGLANDRWN